MAKTYRIATVQLLIDEKDMARACDGLEVLFRSYSDFILDWSYVKVGGQFLHPTEKTIDSDSYKEGDAFI